MKKLKKTVSVFLCLLIIVGVLCIPPLTVGAVEAESESAGMESISMRVGEYHTFSVRAPANGALQSCAWTVNSPYKLEQISTSNTSPSITYKAIKATTSDIYVTCNYNYRLEGSRLLFNASESFKVSISDSSSGGSGGSGGSSDSDYGTICLNFDPNGGRLTTTSMYLKKNSRGYAIVCDLPVPTRSGYEFDYWYDYLSGYGRISYGCEIGDWSYKDEELDLTAIWKAATVNPTSISLSKTSLSLTVGALQTITATVLPSDATDKTVTWTSSNTLVATVSNGTITAKAAGTATITAKTVNNKTATCTVTVTNPTVNPTSISLSKSSLSLTVGASQTITATVLPSDATDKTVTWTSSNTSVATVSNGKITAKAEGSATITARTTNGKFKSCIVTVTNPTINPTSISLSKTSLSLTVGASQTITATVLPSDATDKTVTWTSSNTSVATVSSGKITAKAAGTATITAKTVNNKTATCTVTVKAADQVARNLQKIKDYINDNYNMEDEDGKNYKVTKTKTDGYTMTFYFCLTPEDRLKFYYIENFEDNQKAQSIIEFDFNSTASSYNITPNMLYVYEGTRILNTSATINAKTYSSYVGFSSVTGSYNTSIFSSAQALELSSAIFTNSLLYYEYVLLSGLGLSLESIGFESFDKSETIEPTGISLSKTSLSLTVGASQTITATVSPSNATDKTVTWTSSNTSVATVSNGKITAKAAGTATITAKTVNNKTATCKVTVTSSGLAAPSVSVSNSATGLKASWSAVSNATSYEVHYKASTDSSWTTVATTATSYMMTGLTPGNLYYVKVKSMSGSVKSDSSPTVSLIYVPKANITSLGYNNNTVNAKWGKVSGATRYQVAYKKNGDSSFSTVTTANNTFSLSSPATGISYTFKVRAQLVKDGATVSGAWSEEKTVVTLAKPTVTAARLSSSGTGIYTSWKAVSGATKYRVYYKLSTSSSWYIKVTSSLSYTIKNTPKGKSRIVAMSFCEPRSCQ